MKIPQLPQPKTPQVAQYRDLFQTPNYATDLIGSYVSYKTVWEPAAGTGKIAKRLRDHWQCSVIETDIQTGYDFLVTRRQADYIVTNPPFSLKYDFFLHCMELDMPFALLIPTADSAWTLKAMQAGCQWIKPTRRIDYITPTGKAGKDSAAQMATGWLTKGFNLPEQTMIVELSIKEKKENV